MTKNKNLDEIIINEMLENEQFIVLAEGFEEAFVGVTITTPKRIIYDYWKCLDCIIKKEDLSFDDALDFLREFTQVDLGKNTPIYIKKI